MKAAKLFLTSFVLTGSILLAQVEDAFNRQQRDQSGITSFDDILQLGDIKDYKIISSNSSYIELEFYPSQLTVKKLNFNGEIFDAFNFDKSSYSDFKDAGNPDIKFRSFSVALPSEQSNNVQVTDFDVKELSNINLAPVPFATEFKPGVPSFENIIYSYRKGPRYSENKFIPEKIAALGNTGMVRELTTARLDIYPYQYNPVSRTMKVYTRIRVRVSFGTTPVLYNYPRSREEITLLKDVALNSDLALNWLNPKLKKMFRENPLTPSVLSTGDWYKIKIDDVGDNGKSDGIYKISKGRLDSAGINVSGIDPRTFKLYGNGGFMLPEDLNAARPGDLQQMRIFIEGENDGVFNQQDYILFYGRCVNNWNYDTLTRTYSHYLDYYSRSNYYWLCLNTPGNGMRMNTVSSSPNSAQYSPSAFTEKIFKEPEEINLINEGNLWLSGRMTSGDSKEWNVTLTGLQNGSTILYKIKPASRCLRPPESNINYMLIKDDYSSMPELNYDMGYVAPGFGNWIWTYSTEFTLNQSQKTNGEQVKFRGKYMSNNGAAEGYIDWWEIIYKRRLNSASGDFLFFDSPDTTATVEYNVSPFSGNNVKVFDVTDHNNPKIIQPISASSSNVKFRKDELRGQLSKFMVWGPNGYKLPTIISGTKLPNQNLRGITDGASFVIITDKEYVSAANRLKTKRESGGPGNPNYLKTRIVTVDQIFNEFSGGLLDATAIRDFLKFAYENWNQRPVYVLLLGDGHFDYKNIYGDNPPNAVPAFEVTHPQIDQVFGFTTDDYYVNVTGGNIVPFGGEPPDMAVGRIPANSLEDADRYIDKLDCYENGQYNGNWKNKMLFVADDQMTSDGCEGVMHLAQIEGLAEFYVPETIEKIKIYSVTYPTVITPQGRRKPSVNQDIIKYWNEGVINIHYTGHGSPDVWAHEYILEKSKVMSQLNNECRYPFVTIASCDMSKFDNPRNESAGEEFMLTPKKGAIGTLAATRPVYADGNDALMKKVFGYLYVPRDTLLLPRRFGKAIFDTKQTSNQPNDIKYVLMCDPTLRTQIPRFRSRVDSIAGLSGDTMRALSRVIIYGSIIRPDSSFWSDFNGITPVKVFDVDRQIVFVDPDCPQFTHNFRLNGGIIYAGTQNVVNGRWTAEFIVPKDISYQNQHGKIINYFYNTSNQGSGIYKNFFVGGINPNAPVDSIGPKISLFLNNRNFRSGDIVNKDFKLIADLFDESGINTTGTIGHKIDGILDGNENNKYDLTNFYISDSTYKSGSLEYDFTDVTLGRHVLRLKAWDTYNNSSEKEIEFTVSDASVLNVVNVYNFPNPFKSNTTFTFQHNFPDPIDVRIKIYTVAGRLIKEISKNQISDKFVSIFWQGTDEDGESLGNGVYIYKLMVETGDGQAVTEIGKLAVLK